MSSRMITMKNNDKSMMNKDEFYLKYANMGHASEQNSLGCLYKRGEQGIEQNYKKAFKWFLKSAKKNNIKAMYNVGLMYDLGQGVKKNYEKAFKWYLKSAEQNNFKAMYNVGLMYDLGEGVEKNHKKAFVWYLKAANNNHKYAQNNLGYLYENGFGVEQNYNEALEWYLKSAIQDCHNAKKILENYFKIEILIYLQIFKIKILIY